MVQFALQRLGGTSDYLWIIKELPNERGVHNFHLLLRYKTEIRWY